MVETDRMIHMLEAAITQAPVIAVLIWYVVALRNENRELRELVFDLLLPEATKVQRAARGAASANGD